MGTEQTIKSIDDILSNTKIIIKPIIKGSSFLPKGHDGEFQFSGCATSYCVPLDKNTGRLVAILSKDEQRVLEKELEIEEGGLGFNRTKENFWHTFFVKLDKIDGVLNLADPMDYIRYKLLSVWPEFAPSWSERDDNPEYRYALCKENESQEEEALEGLQLGEAYAALNKMKDSRNEMINILRLLGKPISVGMTKEVCYGQLSKIIQTKNTKQGLITISDFLEAIKDPDAEIKLFIKDAIEIGEVYLRGTKHYLRDSSPISLDTKGAIDFFKDPENNELKILISQQIKRK